MSKRFRIAFSFAGEKKAFVAEVASILAERFGRDQILYYKYHEAEFARGDLALYLPPLYHLDSDLIVVVLCKDYEIKEWPGLEWRAVYGLLKKRKDKEVMLCRFDQIDGDGLFGLGGFIDLDHKTPEQFANLILERLALNQGHSKDFYTRNSLADPDWPLESPPLHWPVANHEEAQRAFVQLLTRDARFRLLLIRGASDTGKSHLTKQFFRHALNLKYIACARFDFKGSADLDNEVRFFARQLKVSLPTPGTKITDQLDQIVVLLEETRRPTLLIFDTFEQAGTAEHWAQGNLLPYAIRAPWLRIIIVGQQVPCQYGETWQDISSDVVQLRPATAIAWFKFGKQHKPDLTLDFVRQAHRYSRGGSALLAQLLGPKV